MGDPEQDDPGNESSLKRWQMAAWHSMWQRGQIHAVIHNYPKGAVGMVAGDRDKIGNGDASGERFNDERLGDKGGIKWAEAARFADPIEADIVKALLESNGFTVRIVFDSTSVTLKLTTKSGFESDIVLMVPEDELENAVELIKSRPTEEAIELMFEAGEADEAELEADDEEADDAWPEAKDEEDDDAELEVEDEEDDEA